MSRLPRQSPQEGGKAVSPSTRRLFPQEIFLVPVSVRGNWDRHTYRISWIICSYWKCYVRSFCGSVHRSTLEVQLPKICDYGFHVWINHSTLHGNEDGFANWEQADDIKLIHNWFQRQVHVHLIFVWPCIIDINNVDNQLDATITVY